jgi:cytochrome c oxidase assembly factor CtaG
MKRAILLASFLAAPATAHSDGAAPVLPGWSFEPWALIPLALSLALYLVGLARLLRRADHSQPAIRRNAILFLLGWLALAGATMSPLHEGGERSFTLHMLEHELIMLLAAPLMALSRPLGVMIWALPPVGRIAVSGWARGGAVYWLWRHATAPVSATIVQIAVIWLWHAPLLFELALHHEGWHFAQHVCFLVSALLFWWAMVFGRAGTNGYGVAALCLFATSLVGGGLGALMTFAISPWYADYAAMGMGLFGLTPEEDQQLAGLLMWIPGGMVHAGAALILLMRWLAAPTSRRETNRSAGVEYLWQSQQQLDHAVQARATDTPRC